MIKSRLLKHTYSKVFVPASVSNAGPGFDAFGFALENLGDIIEVRANESGEVMISSITGDEGKLSKRISDNTTSVAAISILNQIKADFGLEIIINKRMPFASGLGSSAASAVGAAFAVNSLLKEKLSDDKIILHALEGEKIASAGNIHADNVAPAFYGGFTIVRSLDPVDIVRIKFPKELVCLIIYPHISITTKESRQILPANVTISAAVKQSANAGSLIAGILTKDFKLISRSMTDFIAEPIRKKLIPHYDDLRSLVLKEGGLNFNISGSGPALFSLFEKSAKVDQVKKKITEELMKMQIEADVFVSRVNRKGPQLLSVS
jgi:homoserine kinase